RPCCEEWSDERRHRCRGQAGRIDGLLCPAPREHQRDLCDLGQADDARGVGSGVRSCSCGRCAADERSSLKAQVTQPWQPHAVAGVPGLGARPELRIEQLLSARPQPASTGRLPSRSLPSSLACCRAGTVRLRASKLALLPARKFSTAPTARPPSPTQAKVAKARSRSGHYSTASTVRPAVSRLGPRDVSQNANHKKCPEPWPNNSSPPRWRRCSAAAKSLPCPSGRRRR